MDDFERHWNKEFRSTLNSANDPWEDEICDDMQIPPDLKLFTLQNRPSSVEGFLLHFPFFACLSLCIAGIARSLLVALLAICFHKSMLNGGNNVS